MMPLHRPIHACHGAAVQVLVVREEEAERRYRRSSATPAREPDSGLNAQRDGTDVHDLAAQWGPGLTLKPAPTTMTVGRPRIRRCAPVVRLTHGRRSPIPTRGFRKLSGQQPGCGRATGRRYPRWRTALRGSWCEEREAARRSSRAHLPRQDGSNVMSPLLRLATSVTAEADGHREAGRAQVRAARTAPED
jgi:hypothetical protein